MIEDADLWELCRPRFFARCGVSLFHHMGMIDILSFGSESAIPKNCGNWLIIPHWKRTNSPLLIQAKVFEMVSHTRRLLTSQRKRLCQFLQNDILAVEYLKALKNSLPRDQSLDSGNAQTQATILRIGTAPSLPQQLIRKAVFSQDLEFLAVVLPDSHLNA